MKLRLSLLAALSLLGAACAATPPSGSGELRIMVTAYPLAFVAEEVAGSVAEVANLTPPGAEPHDLELTPGRIRDLARSDLVIYVGAGFQPSVEEAVAELDVEALDVLREQGDLRAGAADTHEGEDGHENEVEGKGEGEAGHEDGVIDPHIWLDPRRLVVMGHTIAEHLAETDPPDADTYRAGAKELEERLLGLDEKFRTGLADCEGDTIVTSHQAFGYLTDAYGLREVGIAGIDPESEPSPARLAEVTRLVEQEGVTTIYFERLVPPDLAETLADEAGIATSMLDPLEGPPQEGDYFTAMESNLASLREGLRCR